MTAPTLVLPGGPSHRDDPRAWTIPPTTPDVHAWREQQHTKRGGIVAAMRLRNAEKFALEQAHRAAREEAPKRHAPARTIVRTADRDHAEWRRMYEAGMSTGEIAEKTGRPRTTIRDGIKAAGGTMRTPRHIYQPTVLDEAALVSEYQAGATLRDLAARHHAHNVRIRDVLIAHGVHIRTHADIVNPNANPVWRDPEFVARVNDLLDGGMAQKVVAREVGVSPQQVCRHVARRKAGKA